jgi:hypothetical protein
MAKPAQNVEKWGRATAKERYGTPDASGVTPAKSQQPPQDPEDKHGAKYDNDASGWVRGVGSPYPHFDTHKSGSK